MNIVSIVFLSISIMLVRVLSIMINCIISFSSVLFKKDMLLRIIYLQA